MGFGRSVRAIGLSLVVLGSLSFIACESATRKKTPAAPPLAAAPSPQLQPLPSPSSYPIQIQQTLPPFDAARQVIDQVEEFYRQGEQDYKQGHLDSAKRWFDRAVDALLRSPVPLNADERLEEEFDSLIARIHGYEVLALKEGDGFTTQKYQPAPSDETLNVLTFPPQVDEKLKAVAEKEVTEIAHDLPITVNERVLNFLDYFTHGRGRGAMENGLRRIGMYRPMIQRILLETGVPSDLIYLAQVESGFQPLALSNKKAKGVWQFVPYRGAEYGLAQNWWVDERQDPEKSTRAAARHLKDLHEQFEDWLLAMAAYNCGPGNVQRGIERGGYADFWKMADRKVLPLQTENYVPAILAVTIIAKNPEKYGFSVAPEPPLQAERIAVPVPTDLRLIAETIDSSVETLQQLNPQLLHMTTPPNEPDFQLNLPPGTRDKYLREIALIPEDKRVLWRRHRISEGESLSTIARRYHTSVNDIAQVNDLTPGSMLEEGTKIIIPATASSRKAVVVKHRVERGETFASLAARYDVTERDIRKWNRLGSKSKLQKGQQLTLRMAGHEPAAPAMKAKSRSAAADGRKRSVIHNVRKGETLFSIATNHNTTVDSIRQLNGIRNSHILHAGDKLRIPVSQ